MAASAPQLDILPPVAEWDTQVEVSSLVKYFSKCLWHTET